MTYNELQQALYLTLIYFDVRGVEVGLFVLNCPMEEVIECKIVNYGETLELAVYGFLFSFQPAL